MVWTFTFQFNVTAAYNRYTNASSVNKGVVIQAAPRPPPNTAMNSLSMGVNGQQVNVHNGYNTEPAPMGIADYGIGPNGAYQYNTSSFVGIATINSLATSTSTNDPLMTIQLNVNLAFTSNGDQYVYWIQDAALIDTSSNGISFENNVWNFSARSANMNQLGITGGNGAVSIARGQFFYGYAPGNEIYLQYPATIRLNVTCALDITGEPTVSFAYEDGYGLVTYDSITFITRYPVTSFSGFVVDGYNYNPTGYLFYDSELILGGPGNGATTDSFNQMYNYS